MKRRESAALLKLIEVSVTLYQRITPTFFVSKFIAIERTKVKKGSLTEILKQNDIGT